MSTSTITNPIRTVEIKSQNSGAHSNTVSRQKSSESGTGKYTVVPAPSGRAFNPLLDPVITISQTKDPAVGPTQLQSANQKLDTYWNQISSHERFSSIQRIDTPQSRVIVALSVLQSVEAQEFLSKAAGIETPEQAQTFFKENPIYLKKVLNFYLDSHLNSLKLSSQFPEQKDELVGLFLPINNTYQKAQYGTQVNYSRQEGPNDIVTHTTTTRTQSSGLTAGGSQTEKLEHLRWESVLTQSSLATHFLNLYKDHLQKQNLNITYSNLDEVKSFTDTIFASDRLAYSQYSSSFHTGSFVTQFLLNDKEIKSTFFAANGVVEIPNLGPSAASFGYACDRNYRMMGASTPNSVSVIVAEVIGSKADCAEFGIRSILDSMGKRNSDQFLPFTSQDMSNVQVVGNTIYNREENNDTHLSVVTWWRGPVAIPNGTEKREPFLSVVHLGPGVRHVTSSAGMYDGDNIPTVAPRSIFRATPVEPQSWTTQLPLPRRAIGCSDRWFSYEPQTLTTSFQGITSKWSIVTSQQFPLSDKEIVAIADRYEHYPLDHIAREVFNAAGQVGFCVIGRLHGEVPRTQDSNLNLNCYKGGDYFQLPRTTALTEPDRENLPLLRSRRPGELYSANEDEGLFLPGLEQRLVRLGKLAITQCGGPVDTFKLRGSTLSYGASATSSSLEQDGYTPTRLPGYSSSPYINWGDSNPTYLAQQLPWHAYQVFGPDQKNPNLSSSFIKTHAVPPLLSFNIHFSGRPGVTGTATPDYLGMFVSGSGAPLGDINSPVYHPAHAISLQFNTLHSPLTGIFGQRFALNPGAPYRDEILTAAAYAAIPYNNPHETRFATLSLFTTMSFRPELIPHCFGLGDLQVVNVSRERVIAGSTNPNLFFGKDAQGSSAPLTEKSTWANDLSRNPKGKFAILPSKTLAALGGAQTLSKQLQKSTLGAEGTPNIADQTLAKLTTDPSRKDGLMIIEFK